MLCIVSCLLDITNGSCVPQTHTTTTHMPTNIKYKLVLLEEKEDLTRYLNNNDVKILKSSISDSTIQHNLSNTIRKTDAFVCHTDTTYLQYTAIRIYIYIYIYMLLLQICVALPRR